MQQFDDTGNDDDDDDNDDDDDDDDGGGGGGGGGGADVVENMYSTSTIATVNRRTLHIFLGAYHMFIWTDYIHL